MCLSRQKKVQKELFKKEKGKIDLFLFEDPLSLSYLTGCDVSTGLLLLMAKTSHFFLDGRYLDEMKKKYSGKLSLFFKEWIYEEILSLKKEEITVAFDASRMSYVGYQKWKAFFDNEKIEGKKVHLVPYDNPLKPFRYRKDHNEIEAMKKAATLNWEAFVFLLSELKEGMSEKEAAQTYEIYCIEKGADHLSFPPIVAFGENSAYPHHKTGERKLRKGDVMLFDLGVTVDGYPSDCSRTLFWKEIPPQLEKDYFLIQKVIEEVLKICRVGEKIGTLDQKARDIFKNEGVDELFTHSLGHGIGLEVHEFPRLKCDGEDKDALIETNTFFTIEPGLYREGLGGIRLEDTYLMTKQGPKSLYPPFKKKIIL